MATWRGGWEFRNGMHRDHGTKGHETVTADTEDGAESAIKTRASREICGSGTFYNYIHVTNLTKASG